MKIYKHYPKKILRISTTKKGHKTLYFNIIETTQDEFIQWLKKLIDKQHLSSFQTGNVTSITVRESLGGTNGKSKSISFKGLSPDEIADLINAELK